MKDKPITLSLQLELCWFELGCDNKYVCKIIIIGTDGLGAPRDPGSPSHTGPMDSSTHIYHYHIPSPVIGTPQPTHFIYSVDDQTLIEETESYHDQDEMNKSNDGSILDGMEHRAGVDADEGRKMF